MPSAGHYSDMQTLMQNMETLSGWLQQNREAFSRVQEGLERVERASVRSLLVGKEFIGYGQASNWLHRVDHRNRNRMVSRTVMVRLCLP